MKKLVSQKLFIVSVAVALISGSSPVTATADMEVTVADPPVAAAPVATAAITPAIPASDFSGNTAIPSSVSPSVVQAIPEPGTMLAGFGALTYLLLRTSRRTRA